MLRFGIEPLPDVVKVLTELKERGHQLIILAKGALFDQKSKIARSGLGDFFDYVEIVSDKDEATYRRLFTRIGTTPENFVMIGNSLKSDILPVAELDFPAVHVPYHANWIHEHVPAELLAGVKFRAVERLREVLELVGYRNPISAAGINSVQRQAILRFNYRCPVQRWRFSATFRSQFLSPIPCWSVTAFCPCCSCC